MKCLFSTDSQMGIKVPLPLQFKLLIFLLGIFSLFKVLHKTKSTTFLLIRSPPHTGKITYRGILVEKYSVYFIYVDSDIIVMKSLRGHCVFNPYAAGGYILPIQNDAKKKLLKWLKPWHMGTHLRVLSESYLMNTNMTGLRWSSKIFASLWFGRK